MSQPLILFIDLFCGAGGVTTGVVQARTDNYQPVKVIAGVNHDPKAIESHLRNHKSTVHFTENIRELDMNKLMRVVNYYRKKYPHAKVILWASMECTNYSNAKGGLPRDADSRTLPNAMFRYIRAINPDYFYWENVTEFMSWGPLDDKGRPVSKKNGRDWLKWQYKIESMGYRHEWRVMNSANYGAHTKRKRLFGIFAKDKLPIIWPEATHSEKVNEGMFGNLKPWKPVREVLDFEDEGLTIFGRKKPLVENTLKRIYAGLQKYVAAGESSFLQTYYSGSDWNRVHDTNQPARTLTTANRFSLVNCNFLMKYYGNGENIEGVNGPCGTLTTKDRFTKVTTCWLDKQYRSNLNHQSINKPAGTILTNDKHCMVQAAWLDRNFSGGGQHQSVDKPAGALLTVPKMNMVQIKKPWIIQYSYNNNGNSVDEPCPTLLASRRHHYLAQALEGSQPPEINESDSPTMKLIKQFMHKHGIADIKTRMLKVPELLKIQGFPENYYLAGNQTDQKKFIGNSVVPVIPKAQIEALATELKKSAVVAA